MKDLLSFLLFVPIFPSCKLSFIYNTVISHSEAVESWKGKNNSSTQKLELK